MKSLQLKKYLLIALAALMTVCIALYTGLQFIAAAADGGREVTISGSTIFYTSGGAQVWSHKDGDEDAYYTMFVFTDDDHSVNYRRNLAYEWWSGSKDEESGKVTSAQGLFHMEIGFEETGFDRFVISFDSQQYAETKDGKTTNYLIFAPAEEGYVRVIATDDGDASVPEDAVKVAADHIVISFAKSEKGGAYAIEVGGENVGEFVNIGGTYAKYVSSSTTPVTPLTFQAEISESGKGAYLALYDLNGQSFKLTATPTETSGHYASGKVYDTAAPVLCLDTDISFVGIGKEISFDYTVIDVLASSPSSTTAYFMLTQSQAADDEFNADDYENEDLYRTVADSDNQYMIPHADSYKPGNTGAFDIPYADSYKPENTGAFDGEDLSAEAAVKIAVTLIDTTATGGISETVLLDWYVGSEYVIEVNGYNYIAVADDAVGAAYAYTDDESKTSNAESEEWKALLAAYQEKVTEAAQGLKAGNKNYFYLPSAESLFADNCTSYKDLTFSIYYNNGSQQSSTGKSASALSINLTKAGKYVFTIYVTDAAGNPMYYYDPDWTEGDDESERRIEISTSNIWNMYTQDEDTEFADTYKYLPWFEFTVAGGDISVEDPDEQDIAYVDTTYSSISFEINGVDYDTAYRLFLFENDLYAREINDGQPLTYDEFLSMKEELFTNYRRFFTEILDVSSMEKTYPDYHYYKDYAWNSSSPSFVPQESGFYLVSCEVSSTADGRDSVSAYMVISATEKPRTIAGEDTWVQDNLTSIILLAIAGASFIGIILLLVIKPKEKQDLDEIALDEPKKKSKK